MNVKSCYFIAIEEKELVQSPLSSSIDATDSYRRKLISLKGDTYSILLRFVCGFVEFIEKEEKHNSMHTDPPNKCSWIIAINK